ncbi:MAG: hypothetical protein GY870_22700 [archaeon]|nr:hypothetical protein [archaeon]
MKKVMFIGPPESGKTSTRLFFFESAPLVKILKHQSLEPTMGIDWHNYDLHNTTIGVVDTSGQEIISILSDEALFVGTDVVIYMFDVTQFMESMIVKAEFLEYLYEIITCRNKADGYEIFDIHVLVHKMDLIEKKYIDEICEDIEKSIKEGVLSRFGNDQSINLHFTSLFPDLVVNTKALLDEIVANN